MFLNPIGIASTPYKTLSSAPRQGRHSKAECVLEVFPEYAPGLKDIRDASHLFVLYWCHQADRSKLHSKTPHTEEPKGVFACRAPSRPNPIAICVVEVISVEGNKIRVCGLDAVDGSPLLDIKPYSPGIDAIPKSKY